MLPVEAVSSSTATYLSVNHSFWLVETSFLSTGDSIVLFQVFLCQWKLLLKLGRSQFLKTNHIPASGHQCFEFFRDFLKLEQLFRKVETYISTIFHPASGNELEETIIRILEKYFSKKELNSASGQLIICQWKLFSSIISGSSQLLLVEAFFSLTEAQFEELILASEQLIFWLVETIFFLHFSETPASDSTRQYCFHQTKCLIQPAMHQPE